MLFLYDCSAGDIFPAVPDSKYVDWLAQTNHGRLVAVGGQPAVPVPELGRRRTFQSRRRKTFDASFSTYMYISGDLIGWGLPLMKERSADRNNRALTMLCSALPAQRSYLVDL